MSSKSKRNRRGPGDPRKRLEVQGRVREATRAEKLEMSCTALVDTLDWFRRLKAPQALMTEMEGWVYTIRVAATRFGPGDWETADCFIRDGMSLLDAMLAAEQLQE
jgi:hypothetical protein